MKNKFLILFYFLLLVICTCHLSFAQKENEKSTLDSVIEKQYGDSDTIIKRTLFNDENDSILKWKNKREFAYMNYLDSLLKKKHDLKSDTVSIDQIGEKKNLLRSSDNSAINKFLNSFPLKLFFWVLAIFFIGFIFYKLFFQNGIFKRQKSQNIEIEDIDSIPHLAAFSEYDALIHESEAKNNFNLSIRYLYLQTLKTLSDKGLIGFAPDKTNREYLHEMDSHKYYSPFASLTHYYEYAWYGKFLINLFQYQKLKAEFILFNKKVNAV